MFAVKKKIVLALILAIFVIAVVAIVSFSYNTGATRSSNYPSEQKQLYTHHDTIYIDGNEDFTSENGVTSGSGTESDPYIIEGWDINASSADGIHIENTDAYFIIRNCVIHDGWNTDYWDSYHGIYSYNITNGKINNVISYNNYRGIYICSSPNNNITNSYFYNNYYHGVYLYSFSDNNTVTNCSVYNNYHGGISIGSSSNNTLTNCAVYNNSYSGFSLGSSSNNNIINCIVYNNSADGILFDSSSDNQITDCAVYNNSVGILLYWYSSHNNITNCAVHNNSYVGISLYYSSYNQITYCNITNNTAFGVYIYYDADYPSNYNVFHHNNFINNGQNTHGPHTNYWDNGYPSGGNYWSDYTGVDLYSGPNQDQVGSDGIGDTPYNISGGSNKDMYPLMKPWNITVNQPPIVNITYPPEGQTVNETITITGTAYDPDSAGLTPHAPIYIDGNANFTTENGVVSGSGTEGDPYIIGGWDINASSAHGTEIINTNKYFVIRNCVIHDGKNSYNDGIYFYNVTNGKIDNVTSYNNRFGIYLYYYSSNNNITNCDVYNNYYYGICLYYYSNNNQITNCNVYNNSYYGILLWDSSKNQITNCAVNNNSWGIYLSSSSNNNISANQIYNNLRGVSLEHSWNNNLMANQIYNNSLGIYLWYSSSDWIHYNNICNNTDHGVWSYGYRGNATYNWWGSASGPYHPDTNPNGEGDNVSDNILYNPWLTEPVEIAKNRYGRKDYKNTPIEKDRNLNGATVQFVEVKIDNGSWQLANGTASWSFEWDTTTVDDGWHTIYVRAFDGVDYSEIDSVSVYVDNPIPELIPHEPIYINANDDFTRENGVVFGSGTENDPYIIKGWDINAGTASYPSYAGVHIENTDAYFIIRNCIIHDGYEEDLRYNYGVYFYNVTNGKIENVTSYSNYYGIFLYYSSDNNITKCIVYNNSGYGASFYYSSNSTITSCTVYNNSWYGIELYESANSTVTNCTIYNNSYGISLSRSLNCKVENCTVYNHTWYGILVSSQSSNNRIVNCVVYNSSYGGIQISSSVCNLVINCSIYNNSRYGIYSSYSQYNQIANSILYNNTYYNIYLSSSLYDQITNCVLYNSNYGGYFYACLYDKISECTFYNNRYYGIYFTSSLYNQIKNNSVINCSTGICFYFSFYNQITNCVLNSNSNFGGYFQFSSNNTVTRCNISANNWGFYLYLNSNNNYIYHNIFINNTNNAYDECINYWDRDGEGNHWDNYTGADSNGDCIGDSPYSISGGNNKDNYPLMHEFTWWDTEMPVISLLSPDNNSVIKPGTVLKFDITDDNLWRASYSMNNGVIQYFSSPYNISTNGWGDGTYNITIYAKDWGMSEISKMFIFIIDGTPPTVTIIEGNQIINTTSFTMHWTTNATDIQYYEISMDGGHWVNVGTNTSYMFTNLAEGFNILYVRGIDLVNNTGISSSITIVVEIPISEEIAPHKEEINWLLYGSIIIVIFIALILSVIGITWGRRREKRRRAIYIQRVKCAYCQEIAKITSSNRPLLFQCQKCGGKSVIR